MGAFFGTLFYATYTFSYASGGADYHNGSGAFLSALFLDLPLRAAETKVSVRWTVATGVMVALSVHSIIVMANLVLIPVVFFVAHYRNLHDRWPPILRTILLARWGGRDYSPSLRHQLERRAQSLVLPASVQACVFVVSDSTHQSSWWHDWSTPWYLSTSRLYLFPAAAAFWPAFRWPFTSGARKRTQSGAIWV